MLRHLPEHDTADLASYGEGPGAPRGALAALRGRGNRVLPPPPAPATVPTPSQVTALELLRTALEHRDEAVRGAR
jgi:hypothetical protein